jgi:hypothetical protein
LAARANFPNTIAWALAAAFACFLLHYFGGDGPEGMLFFWIGMALSLSWLVLSIFSAVKIGWRGLWALIGAPFALYTPIALALAFSACSHSDAHSCL